MEQEERNTPVTVQIFRSHKPCLRLKIGPLKSLSCCHMKPCNIPTLFLNSLTTNFTLSPSNYIYHDQKIRQRKRNDPSFR